ncbi:type II toxin-antitoxin system Phd/YefM family antitoxin [Aquibium carbonis]|uniref:Antitoxin n=1 Tax=Aquibium carbonis TaxID=2495581 RepID=A0A3S0AAS4_9HYPH|nr:type II toxin-antitoxin system Phd/YefM family antitoxin [Aquibium carbonis]RST88498.1 type II toxin-antitoxin system Phd/YefM family antitoxin [Aquibium carbonis]
MGKTANDDLDVWTLATAKARLSEVVERAQDGPQMVTRNGKPAAVIVSAEEWKRKTQRKGNLAEFLLASPLRGQDLDFARLDDQPRDLEP